MVRWPKVGRSQCVIERLVVIVVLKSVKIIRWLMLLMMKFPSINASFAGDWICTLFWLGTFAGRLFFGLLDLLKQVGEHERAQEDEACADPVRQSERILKVNDRNDETCELPESQHQGDRQRRAFSREHKHWTNADVLR